MRQLLAKQIIEASLEMTNLGINQGCSGNISVRYENGFLITPSGIAYDKLRPDKVVFIDATGQWKGENAPSSEWRMHQDIYKHRSCAEAVVHAHSTFATVLSCLRRSIPAFHYMVGVAGGGDIRCSDYALFGTQALSDAMLVALKNRKACLLGSHGQICFHDDLEKSLALAVQVETLAKQYWYASQAGSPAILSNAQMKVVLKRFQTYGLKRGPFCNDEGETNLL